MYKLKVAIYLNCVSEKFTLHQQQGRRPWRAYHHQWHELLYRGAFSISMRQNLYL
jgi:hypothetical protein